MNADSEFELRLRPPGPADEAAVRAAHQVMAAEDFEFAIRLEPDLAWSRYLELVQDERAGRNLPDGWVPGTFLLAEVDGQIVGRTSIRHSLNDWLLRVGGHIGYGVLPGWRRRGYATEILRKSLVIARQLGIERVLVTCDDDNVGSIKVIERCGGRLESIEPTTPPKRRYWIG